MKNFWSAFKEGFLGSFVLASAIVMALVSVAGAFANGDLTVHDKQKNDNKATLI